MSLAPTNRMPSPSRSEWEGQKVKIMDLYITKKNKLRDVMRMMQQDGFTASEQQYKIKFNEWGMSKYKKGGARVTATRRADPSNAQGEVPATSEICAPDHPQPFPEVQMNPLDFPNNLSEDMTFYPNDYVLGDFNIYNVSDPFQPMNLGTPTSTKLRQPIHQAAQSGNLAMAAQNGHTEVVKKLLDAGAKFEPSTNSYDDETPSPLWLAAQQGHCEIAKLLIDSGANVNFSIQPSRRCPLHQAAQNGYVDMVALLIQQEADVDAREKDGWSPLMITAQENFAKIVDLLLQKGANVNAEEKDGATALWVASQQGHAEVVKVLLDRGAQSYPTKSARRQPIHQAAQNGHLEVIKMLLDKYPEGVDAEEKEGITPLFLASQGDKPGHFEVAEYLLEMGAKVVLT